MTTHTTPQAPTTTDHMACGCTFSLSTGWVFSCNRHRGMNRKDAAISATQENTLENDYTPDDDVPPNGIPF